MLINIVIHPFLNVLILLVNYIFKLRKEKCTCDIVMKILPGPSSIKLAEEVASIVNIENIDIIHKLFFDGESYIQIDSDVENEEIIIIQSTHPPQEKHLLELLLLGSTLKELNADKVHAIVPYLSYSRADVRQLRGEIISHQIIVDLIQQSGIDSLFTINVHNKSKFLEFTPELEKYNLNIYPYISEYIQRNLNGDWIILGPDQGASEDVKIVGNILSAPFYWLDKKRDPISHEISMVCSGFDLKEKDIILVDDIVSSGSTALKACQLILEQEPSSLRFVCIHDLSRPEFKDKLKELGVKEFISTNTIPNTHNSKIDIAPFLSNFIEEKFV